MTVENPNDISRLRISDADRDRAASILGDALAEGRLSHGEHAERIDVVYVARTQADILPVLADLPGAAAAFTGPGNARTGPGYGRSPARASRSAKMVAVFSACQRRGVWQVPEAINAVAVLGGVDLDLREAMLPSREIRIRAFSVLGGVDITVPPEMHVTDDGWALLGGREIPPDNQESLSPGAPVLRVSGLSILGGLSVRRKRRKARRH